MLKLVLMMKKLMLMIIPVVFMVAIFGLYALNVIFNRYRYRISNQKLMMMLIKVLLHIECSILLALFLCFLLECVGNFQSSLSYINAFLNIQRSVFKSFKIIISLIVMIFKIFVSLNYS